MGCGCSKQDDSGKPSKIQKLFLCYCCCKPKKQEVNHGKTLELPKVRAQVPTYDVTAYKRPKVKEDAVMSETTISIMTFSQNNERPTDLDRQAAVGNPADQLYYVKLDETEETNKNNSNSEPKTANTSNEFKLNEMQEEATKM